MPRVVITGMGAVTPVGNDVETFVASLTAGKVGFNPITHFDATETGVTLAGELTDFDPLQRLKKRDLRRMDGFSQYAMYATGEAMEQAGINDDNTDSERLGVIYGSGIGGLTTIQEQVIKMHDKGPDRVSPMFVPTAISNMASGNIAIHYNAQNICTTIVTACASGTNAIGEAFRQIKDGRADVMITGGAEASINEIGIAGFAALSTLSKATDPEKASRPFDAARDGFVMGEGAGTLILESLEHAQARGAEILGEIVGYGSTSDAYHITSPDPAGTQASRAMKLAIEEADITPADVDYINAHGTATKGNDSAESLAINKLFGEDSDVLVSSTKSMTGHLLGAAGAIEAVATTAALQSGKLPLNVGITEQDPECQVNLVTKDNQNTAAEYAISNSFGFGGHNAVLAFRRWA
ncbi:beta-ketoacyl-[acyl-carrier-protein] synthase II [Secundilactobacillus paracollinoides]|uniref:3-oxoacyl-[acyl-carrier-protein] synthase 2 n=1 Tax=Secundilactobacillus paracollinoides TaxID=240427 RepID=A0A1B2J1I3_9LACO|nr:beta-ketoacyl-ACP synthase II [Secundilactobacillus paracollinoides]ANZ62151.1 beta-ketoacyl-[acyl-carrier-protein] synthase II [Secundilactobacillus paracollinoides]ANZ63840.1 beta-ketoacyl-[acyl-carrier-protein] synthase II [Secundilactobacillus paracollinoides]ANZ68098.1 beta-ketoacyl-[acyl-carrier-protein] synthase II [Secundilactobacillus paracollinoides]